MTYRDEVLEDEPIAYWPLGEAPGSTVMADYSGGGHNGTFVGPPSLGEEGLLFEDPDTCIYFNGSTYCEVAYGSWMEPAAYSLEAIFVPGQTGAGARTIVSRKTDIGPWALRIDNTTLGFWTLNSAGNGWQIVNSSTTMVSGDTYHVVVTKTSAGLVSLYVNGIDSGSDTFPGFYSSNEPMRIGSVGNGERFVGHIDEVAFYDKALSPARISSHYIASAMEDPGEPPLPVPVPSRDGLTTVSMNVAIIATSTREGHGSVAELLGYDLHYGDRSGTASVSETTTFEEPGYLYVPLAESGWGTPMQGETTLRLLRNHVGTSSVVSIEVEEAP